MTIPALPLRLQVESVRLTRNNPDVRPFEAGGEAPMERHAAKAGCGLVAVGSHSKKRPHNLTLGRMYDGHVYDLLEVGVSSHEPIAKFSGAALAQIGNKVRPATHPARGQLHVRPRPWTCMWGAGAAVSGCCWRPGPQESPACCSSPATPAQPCAALPLGAAAVTHPPSPPPPLCPAALHPVCGPAV